MSKYENKVMTFSQEISSKISNEIFRFPKIPGVKNKQTCACIYISYMDNNHRRFMTANLSRAFINLKVLAKWLFSGMPEYIDAIKNGIHTKLIYHHHHHHIALVARISLILSRHSSLSFIALGRSSGQHPVSSHSS